MGSVRWEKVHGIIFKGLVQTGTLGEKMWGTKKHLLQGTGNKDGGWESPRVQESCISGQAKQEEGWDLTNMQ